MAEKKTENSNQVREYIDTHKKVKNNLYKTKIKSKLQITALLSLVFVLAFGIFSPIALTVFFAIPLFSLSRDIFSSLKFKFLSRKQENIKNEMRDVVHQDNVKNEESKNISDKYINKIRNYIGKVKRIFSNNTKKDHSNSGDQSFFGIIGISLLAIVGVSIMLFGVPYIFVVVSVGISTAAFASMGAERLTAGCHKDIIKNAVNFQNIDNKDSTTKSKTHNVKLTNSMEMDNINTNKQKSTLKNGQKRGTNISR